ncbi:MAG: hypothetical protein CMB29_03045 [Euryarchaeota archaeon]|nr:hypothetical protein [Euryarchaeota archaeon]|tara:strand:+ start:460 stop:669 length:210 start_codon:yes stop_codon:yes gene_type:complete
MPQSQWETTSIVHLLLFQLLQKFSEIFPIIEFKDQWGYLLTFLALILLSGHKSEVGINSDAVTKNTSSE